MKWKRIQSAYSLWLETSVDTIISEAKRYPMMANHNVLIVKEAQNLKDIEDLEPYVENPQNPLFWFFAISIKSWMAGLHFPKNYQRMASILKEENI